MFNAIQTFFVDPDAVQGASSVLITGVDLFFKSKPAALNVSGMAAPGVSVKLCDVKSTIPDLTTERTNLARVEYGSVFAVADSSVGTSFVFNQPIVVTTGQYYGLVIHFDDPGYVLWVNKAGDALVGTNQVSPGATTSRDGLYFTGATNDLTPSTTIDLKYRVNIAKFNTGSTTTADLFNKNYEFMTVTARSGQFSGGEDLFVTSTQLAGTINVASGNTTVTGTGTSLNVLSPGQKVVIQSGGTYRVATVFNVSNTSSMTLKDPIQVTNGAAVIYTAVSGLLVNDNYVTNKITLRGSSANSTVAFVGGSTIRGATSNAVATVVSVDNLSVDSFVSHINVVSQSVSATTTTYGMAQANGANYAVANTYASLPKDTQIDVGATKRFILSRSNEAAQSNLFQPNLKSADVRLTLGTTNPYSAPYLNAVDADLTINQMLVSNTVYDAANNDTEVTGHGIAFTKHFTKKMTFEKDRQAEDIRVFASIYRPAGTDVRVYAKIWSVEDSEPFDDKLWTLLEHKNGRSNVFSSAADKQNFIDYEFGFPLGTEYSTTIAGGFSGVNGNATINSVNAVDLTTVLSAGRYVSFFDPLFPQNEFIARAQSVSASSINLSSNAPATFTGRNLRLLKYPTAFVNPNTTGGVVRYFNMNGSQFDGYNTVQVKIVLLANDSHVVPVVDEIEVFGLSA
jgi:hypothetical protein